MVWNNRRPKFKYNTIRSIGDYFQGGLKVPDLHCRIKTQRIMWVKRIITQLQGPATELLNLTFKYLGGLECIGSYFDIKGNGDHSEVRDKFCSNFQNMPIRSL